MQGPPVWVISGGTGFLPFLCFSQTVHIPPTHCCINASVSSFTCYVLNSWALTHPPNSQVLPMPTTYTSSMCSRDCTAPFICRRPKVGWMWARVSTFSAWELWAPLLQISKVALTSPSSHSCSQERQSQLLYTYKPYQPSTTVAFPWLSNPTTSSMSMYSKPIFGNIPFKEVFGELYPC